MMVAAMITATIITAAAAVLEYERQAASRVILTTAYAFAGLGFLSKGLIGVVLPGGVIFFWLLGRRRFDSMRHLIYLPGLAVLAAITLPWMLVMEQRYPGFFDYSIDRTSVVSGRGVSVRVDLGGRRIIKKKINKE